MNLTKILGFVFLTGITLLPFDALGKNKVTQWSQSLNYMQFQVNGRPSSVKAGEVLYVVLGDTLKIVDGYLNQSDKKPLNLNFIGYNNAGINRAGEDRGIDIKITRKALLFGWATGPSKNVFKIAADTGNVRHGFVLVQVVKPVLEFAQIKINGVIKVFRSGDVLNLQASDKWEVQSVKTNLGNNDLLDFNIHRRDKSSSDGKAKFDLIFTRLGAAFAKLVINVEGL